MSTVDLPAGEGQQAAEERDVPAIRPAADPGPAADPPSLPAPARPDTALQPGVQIPPAPQAATADDPPPPRAWLVFLSGPEDGARWAIPGVRAVIGRRGEGLDLRLAHDNYVSATHAEIAWRAGRWWLRDLGSANGTFLGADERRVNGELVPLDPLTPFLIGHTDLMLVTD